MGTCSNEYQSLQMDPRDALPHARIVLYTEWTLNVINWPRSSAERKWHAVDSLESKNKATEFSAPFLFSKLDCIGGRPKQRTEEYEGRTKIMETTLLCVVIMISQYRYCNFYIARKSEKFLLTKNIEESDLCAADNGRHGLQLPTKLDDDATITY